MNPTEASVTTGNCTLKFDAQESDVSVSLNDPPKMVHRSTKSVPTEFPCSLIHGEELC